MDSTVLNKAGLLLYELLICACVDDNATCLVTLKTGVETHPHFFPFIRIATLV